MSITRRGFLKTLAAAVAGVAVAPSLSLAKTPPVATGGWSASTAGLQVGDVITIEGVHSVNPKTYETTARRQQFVITRVDENALTVDHLSPKPCATGVYQNVDRLPRPGARIFPLGERALVSREHGISVRFVQQFDVAASKAFEPQRWDVLAAAPVLPS